MPAALSRREKIRSRCVERVPEGETAVGRACRVLSATSVLFCDSAECGPFMAIKECYRDATGSAFPPIHYVVLELFEYEDVVTVSLRPKHTYFWCVVRETYLLFVLSRLKLAYNYAKGKGAADNDKNRRLAEKSPELYETLRSIMTDGADRCWRMESGSV